MQEQRYMWWCVASYLVRFRIKLLLACKVLNLAPFLKETPWTLWRVPCKHTCVVHIIAVIPQHNCSYFLNWFLMIFKCELLNRFSVVLLALKTLRWKSLRIVKIVVGPILIHNSNLSYMFFLEAIGQYYSVQDQTAWWPQANIDLSPLE